MKIYEEVEKVSGSINIDQSKVISINEIKCDQIHDELLYKKPPITDLGSKFRFYESNWDQKCAIFILSNKNKIDHKDYTKNIDIAVRKILNLHIQKYNRSNVYVSERLDKLFKRYVEDSKVDQILIDLIKEVYLVGKSNAEFQHDLDKSLKNKEYIQYISSYNFFGIIQFLILTIIILITFILYFYFLKRSK